MSFYTKTFEVFITFLRLGLTSFGGPIAHLGYFHDEFVSKRKWIEEHSYADLVGLCQFLPGPASSQVGMALGFSRAGYYGAFAAWLGFTLPSAIILIGFAFGISNLTGSIQQNYLHGLKIAAVAVVAHAVWSMSTKICVDKTRIGIAITGAILSTFFPTALGQISVILFGGIFGLILINDDKQLPHTPFIKNTSKRNGTILLVIFFLLLFLLPFLAHKNPESLIKEIDSFYRSGSLVFGGGHVVIPLLKNEVANSGWVSNEAFMAGYGAAQAIPGPLFAFTAYLGAISSIHPGILGAMICLVAAFLPSYLLVIGILPFWEELRQNKILKIGIKGINAAVVGLLISALYNPVWTSAIYNLKDFSLALLGFVMLLFWKAPSWLVVIICALVSGFILVL